MDAGDVEGSKIWGVEIVQWAAGAEHASVEGS